MIRFDAKVLSPLFHFWVIDRKSLSDTLKRLTVNSFSNVMASTWQFKTLPRSSASFVISWKWVANRLKDLISEAI